MTQFNIPDEAIQPVKNSIFHSRLPQFFLSFVQTRGKVMIIGTSPDSPAEISLDHDSEKDAHIQVAEYPSDI